MPALPVERAEIEHLRLAEIEPYLEALALAFDEGRPSWTPDASRAGDNGVTSSLPTAVTAQDA